MNRILSALLFGTLFFGLPVNAKDSYPGQMVVLGDSLSDSGNWPEINLNVFPFELPVDFILGPAAPQTDGTTWAVWTSDQLKMERLLPNSQGGTNFAFVAALTDGESPPPVPPGLVVPISDQVLQIPDSLCRNSPVFTLGGANDFILVGRNEPLPADTPVQTAQNLSAIVDSIHAKGFKTQVVSNLMDLAKVPSSSDEPFSTFNPDLELLEDQVILCNQLLAKEMENKDYPVLGIDIFSFLNDIIDHPLEYGFTNVTEAVPAVQYSIFGFVVPPEGSPPDGYLFYYDGSHPTHKAHRSMADFVYATLTAPALFAKLPQCSFTVSRAIMANLWQQSLSVQPCHRCGKIYPFISGNFDPLLNTPNLRSDYCKSKDRVGGDITYGFTWDFATNWRLGLSGAYAKHFFDYGSSLSWVDNHLSTNGVSTFLNYQDSCSYLFGAFTASWHNFSKLKRSFKTGFAKHTANGKTTGVDYHGELRGAYLGVLSYGAFSSGPLFDLNYQRAHIDGYKEKGARIGNLEYRGLSTDIFATGFGWEIQYFDTISCGLFTDIAANAYLMGNRQWLGSIKDFSFRQISFGENFGTWPTTVKRKGNYASLGLSFSTTVNSSAVINFGYTANVGSLDRSEQIITLGLTAPFGCM